MTKIRQTEQELEDQLGEQINFLKKSIESFDEGYLEEAKRMSVVIRTLVHDTSRSKSLLKQLGKKDLLFVDSAYPYNPDNFISQFCLLSFNLNSSGAHFSALLDKKSDNKKVKFTTWWNSIIIADKYDQKITRKDLVLTLANQDGGAHVDPKLDEIYANLFRLNSLNVFVDNREGVQKPMKHAHLVSVRQITHEILKTLFENYTCEGPSPKKIPNKLKNSDDVTSEANSITFTGPRIKNGRIVEEPFQSTKIGRNDECPCGSGRKFKYCHGT